MQQYYVIYQVTKGERDGPMQMELGNETLPCLYVVNKIFDNVPEAAKYAESLPKARQARVVELKGYRCPFSGEWYINDVNDIEKEYTK